MFGIGQINFTWIVKAAKWSRVAWFFLYRILSLWNSKCTKVNWTTLRNPFFTLVLCKKLIFSSFLQPHIFKMLLTSKKWSIQSYLFEHVVRIFVLFSTLRDCTENLFTIFFSFFAMSLSLYHYIIYYYQLKILKNIKNIRVVGPKKLLQCYVEYDTINQISLLKTILSLFNEHKNYIFIIIFL